MFKTYLYYCIKLIVFWLVVFQLERLIFSVYYWDKVVMISKVEWFKAFYHCLRLDIATAGGLSIIPLLFLTIKLFSHQKWVYYSFLSIIILELLLISLIQTGELITYQEWNHKLTARVFKHLSHPDEVVKTASIGMTIWFFVLLILELMFSLFLIRKIFKNFDYRIVSFSKLIVIPISLVSFVLIGGVNFVLLRGGLQQIPININSAMYSKHPFYNDVSINTPYHFFKSYLLYRKTNIDQFIPKIDSNTAVQVVADLYDYPKLHDNYILDNKRPNIVFVIFEGWAGDAIGAVSGKEKSATPNFDQLARTGYLFSNIYATSGTSDIGNSSIFSGFPAIPEVSITMQPEKNRKLVTLNQSLKPFGYSSGYMFGGDVKYGNIGGFLMDHNFDKIIDENALPTVNKRGKLNYYDEDLYRFFIDEINQAKAPFLQCVFTGSSHSPYDHPPLSKKIFNGNEADYMNSLVYSDKALGLFMKNVRKQKWFKNTLFVFVSDHGHCTEDVTSPSLSEFFKIPLLFWGEPLKREFRNKVNSKIGAQCDIVRTLLYQMKIPVKNDYPWSKDILNSNSPEFAFHTIMKGYGWKSPNGFYTKQMEGNIVIQDSLPSQFKAAELEKCHSLFDQVYKYYKKL